MQQDAEALDLGRALSVFRRRAPLIALCVVVVAAAAYGFSKHETKKYTATASLVFSDNSLSQQITGLSAGSSGGSGNSSVLVQQANNLELVKGGDIAAKTASALGHGLTQAKVSGSVKVAGQGESGVVDVSVTSTSPTLSTDIANTYTHQFVAEQQTANHQYFKSALALIYKQLGKLSPKQREGPDGLQLQDRAQTLSLLSELHSGDVQAAQEALPPASPSSPKTSRNTALGVLLGLLIGLGLAFVLERFDHRIKDPDELERVYRLPLLGAVPKSAVLSCSAHDKYGKRAVLPPTEGEVFNLIRAHLRFFDIHRDLRRTVVITSAGLGDGNSTIARHLAEATTRLGSRVLLLETDLRHPTLAQQLDIQSGPGLADVLIGAIPMGKATQSVELEETPGKGDTGRTLDVLTAGAALPPNPAELVASDAMHMVLEQAKSAYDLIVIDTPPLTIVSDAFPLLTKVDGVIIVARIGRSRRDAAGRLHQVLASSGAPVLGVIANCVKTRRNAPYAYAYSRTMAPSTMESASPNGALPAEEPVPTGKGAGRSIDNG